MKPHLRPAESHGTFRLLAGVVVALGAASACASKASDEQQAVAGATGTAGHSAGGAVGDASSGGSGNSTAQAGSTAGGSGANTVGGSSFGGGESAGGGGVASSAGSSGSFGNSGSGGAVGGTAGSSGSGGSGGVGVGVGGGAGAATTGLSGPCDIYAAGNTPCVAAHSTVRSLYGAYNGNLYQVRRGSDKTTKDVGVQGPGGYVNSATQDTFCAGTTCTISIIYDQSAKANHLKVTPPGGWLKAGGTEANATAAKAKVKGNTVYGVYTTGSFDDAVGGVGYRNNMTTGVATGDQPEGIYMVAGGKHSNQYCCFDYGNAETNNKDNGPATMEALYFGSSTQWGRGSGSGPWAMADLEDGIFAGQSFAAPATNTSLNVDYVTAMLKGKPGNFALKGGDAQSGMLKAMYDGKYPNNYSPMKKEGAIILGVGGDNSHTGQGTFFEGCITAGYPSDATDDAVQANIVAAGYGR
ncbi:MAG: arabinofuranosidase catalytic domain-containing protein [Polyangiaceae bacterium]